MKPTEEETKTRMFYCRFSGHALSDSMRSATCIQKVLRLFSVVLYNKRVQRLRTPNQDAVQRLLILSCSQRKLLDQGVLPAIERYDGPTFRVLRRYCREHSATAPTVYVLSAEFGLIDGSYPIPYYDRPMDLLRANEIRAMVECKTREILLERRWDDIGLCLGKQYLNVLSNLHDLVLQNPKVHFLTGGLGTRLSALYGWLRAT